jgi:hypothetical protein
MGFLHGFDNGDKGMQSVLEISSKVCLFGYVVGTPKFSSLLASTLVLTIIPFAGTDFHLIVFCLLSALTPPLNTPIFVMKRRRTGRDSFHKDLLSELLMKLMTNLSTRRLICIDEREKKTPNL